MSFDVELPSLESFRRVNHSKPFEAETAIVLVERLLSFHGNVDFEIFLQACTSLHRLAEATWWACDCTKLSPMSGVSDFICDQCGEQRKLPPRLTAHPWPLFVSCLKRMYGKVWFETLSLMFAQDEGVMLQTPASRDSILECITHRSEGVGSVLAQSANSAEGETSPQLLFPDGMKILSSGELLNLQWIAYPLPIISI